MKLPVDPNEPLFPVRDNEPICQYYMKHGTCKFGQACKFNHPPQSAMAAALVGGGGATVVMANMGGIGGRKMNDAPQIVVSSDGSPNGGTPMMLQFLPQRPDEQDCIFFLKNGRCKYGATCRYHHPINFNQNQSGLSRQADRRQRMQVQQGVPEGYTQHANVQFIGQSSNGGGYHQQQQQQQNDGGGPLTYLAVDNSSGKGSYHPLSVVSNDGYCAPTGAPISHNQDHTSSTSSIASSYDTANSNLDYLVSHGGGGGGEQHGQSSGLWNRQKNNGSHASLNNAYDLSSNRRIVLPQSTSDGSIASGRHRAASYGSASESGMYTGAGGNMAGRPPPSGGTMSGGAPAWRNERSPSFDNGRARSGSGQYRTRGEMPNNGSHRQDELQGQGQQHQSQHGHCHGPPISGGHGRRPPPVNGRRRSAEHVDQGLSMMTSALLTMLDTTEEVAGEGGYEYDYEDMQHHLGGHTPSTGMPMRQDMAAPRGRDMYVQQHSSGDGRNYEMRQGDQRIDHNAMYGGSGGGGGGLVVNSPAIERQYHHHDPQALNSEEGTNWLPNWQGTKSVGPGDAQSMSVMQSQHAQNSVSPHNASNVGLFLP